MKKVILLLAVFLLTKFANSQRLDTVYIRNLTLQAQDWAYLIGKYPDKVSDSTTAKAFRTVRDKIRAAGNLTWTTNVNIDSLPGFIGVAFYSFAKQAPAGEIAARYSAITSALSAKANIAYWVGYIDANTAADFDRIRNLGKNFAIDN